jgi:hypothetical protein
MGNRAPNAGPLILAAILIGVAIWGTIGAPHANIAPIKHHYAGPP